MSMTPENAPDRFTQPPDPFTGPSASPAGAPDPEHPANLEQTSMELHGNDALHNAPIDNATTHNGPLENAPGASDVPVREILAGPAAGNQLRYLCFRDRTVSGDLSVDGRRLGPELLPVPGARASERLGRAIFQAARSAAWDSSISTSRCFRSPGYSGDLPKRCGAANLGGKPAFRPASIQSIK